MTLQLPIVRQMVRGLKYDSLIYGTSGWLPSAMFALSQSGIWIDGSDNSVMWQDAAGTIPVTDLGQPVGLVLDKRLWGGKTLAQVLAEQPERVPHPINLSIAPWETLGTLSEITASGFTNSSGAGAGRTLPNVLTVGKHYQVTASWAKSNSVTTLQILAGSGNTVFSTTAASGTVTFFTTAVNTNIYLRLTGSSTTTVNFTELSFREIPGNYASQSTPTMRPVWQEDDLGARGLLFNPPTNNSLVTPSIDFSASDKMLVAAGVRKLSDATTGILVELSTNISTNNGSFYFGAPDSNGTFHYRFGSKGTSYRTTQYINTSVAAPTSNVLVGLGDIGGDITRLRVDGGQVSENTDDQGTGNFGNYPLYIGRRGGASLPFSGFVHQLVIRGGTWPDAAELAQLEAFIGSKSKVSL